jgi:hypothetical protein
MKTLIKKIFTKSHVKKIFTKSPVRERLKVLYKFETDKSVYIAYNTQTIQGYDCVNIEIERQHNGDYEIILKTEAAIIKQQIELGLKEGHHFPVKLTQDQVDMMKNAGIEIIELNSVL